mmetsp:Transcript_25615/g.82956  ORF Transcript_25615/g.82956 Transcript_25615/m.82956 type:complete len:444 (+) Transcript_25615:826-2157(+)
MGSKKDAGSAARPSQRPSSFLSPPEKALATSFRTRRRRASRIPSRRAPSLESKPSSKVAGSQVLRMTSSSRWSSSLSLSLSFPGGLRNIARPPTSATTTATSSASLRRCPRFLASSTRLLAALVGWPPANFAACLGLTSSQRPSEATTRRALPETKAHLTSGVAMAWRASWSPMALDIISPPGQSRKGLFLRESSSSSFSSESQQLCALRDSDVAIARLCAMVPVDVVPGESDPTNASLPQQPVHPLLTPHAARYSTFVAATNPHECTVDGHLVCGHAGQPVKDILKHADYEESSLKEEEEDPLASKDARRFFGHAGDPPDPDCLCVQRAGDGPDDSFLAALEDTLYWRHLAPTAPDSLPAYPHRETDPFVLEDVAPRLLFAGGAPHFATSLATNKDHILTRIVALPSFANTGIAVLVDLETLNVDQLQFNPDHHQLQHHQAA